MPGSRAMSSPAWLSCAGTSRSSRITQSAVVRACNCGLATWWFATGRVLGRVAGFDGDASDIWIATSAGVRRIPQIVIGPR